jgi:hypothetical protein
VERGEIVPRLEEQATWGEVGAAILKLDPNAFPALMQAGKSRGRVIEPLGG